MGKQATEARKEIYAFILDTLGVKMTPQQHDELKKLLVANANGQAEDLLRQIGNLEESLRLRPVKKKKIWIKTKE